MKNSRLVIQALALAAIAAALATLYAAEKKTIPAFEYVTIRWAGKDDTHIVRPGGQVEFIGRELRKLSKPSNADDRAFYMNAALNGLSKEGFEFAGMSDDEIVVRRRVGE